MKTIIVTGSRHHADPTVITAELDRLLVKHRSLTVVVGDCPSGADLYASDWCRSQDPAVVTRVEFRVDPADGWPAAGPRRNQRMINHGGNELVAFPQGGARNIGTWDCHRRAVVAGIPTRVVPENWML